MTINRGQSSTRGISLFPEHYALIEQCAAELRLRGNTFSPAVQFILEEWAEQRALLSLLTPASLAALRRQLAARRAAEQQEEPR